MIPTKRMPTETFLWEPPLRRQIQEMRSTLADPADPDQWVGLCADPQLWTDGPSHYLWPTTPTKGEAAKFFHLSELMVAGEREFRIADGLAASLVLTEVRGLSDDDVKVPYPTVLFRLPPLLTNVSERAGACAMGAVIVTACTMDSHRYLSLFFLGDEGVRTRPPGPGVMPVKSRDIWCPLPFAGGKDLSVSFEHFEDVLRGSPAVAGFRSSVAGDDPVQSLVAAVRLIVNTLLYITLPSADIQREGHQELERIRAQARKHPKGSRKRARAQEKLKAAERNPVFRLGGSLRIPGRVSEAARLHAGGKRKFTASWMVIGHWRKQHYGPGRQKSKPIWIQPQVRRRDLGVLAPKPYEVS